MRLDESTFIYARCSHVVLSLEFHHSNRWLGVSSLWLADIMEKSIYFQYLCEKSNGPVKVKVLIQLLYSSKVKKMLILQCTEVKSSNDLMKECIC